MMGLLFNNDRNCRNCFYYSASNGFCMLHGEEAESKKGCADFHEISFLDKAFRRVEEYTPKVMDAFQKAQEKEIRKQEEMEEYKAKYTGMSSRELRDRINQGVSGTERAAIVSVSQERKAEQEKYLKLYSDMGSIELRQEYAKNNIQKRQGLQSKPVADMKLAIIAKILKDRGYRMNSDLEWYKCE